MGIIEHAQNNPIEFALITINLVLGIGFAVPVVIVLKKLKDKPRSFFHNFCLLMGIYSGECAAIVMGMGVPVFSVGLALIWGVVLGRWLRDKLEVREALKTSFYMSLYSSLPALSFVIIPILIGFGGRSVLSVEGAGSIGIPIHLPWPLDTILGFYVVPALGAMVLKAIITTGEVSLIIKYFGKS